jgi:hypothetical protein
VGVTASGTGAAYNTAFALHVSKGRVRLITSLHEVEGVRTYGADMIATLREVDGVRTYGADLVTSLKEVEDGR